MLELPDRPDHTEQTQKQQKQQQGLGQQKGARAPPFVVSVNAVASVSLSAVCDQVDQVVPAHQVDDIDEVHELDPVYQVDI